MAAEGAADWACPACLGRTINRGATYVTRRTYGHGLCWVDLDSFPHVRVILGRAWFLFLGPWPVILGSILEQKQA